MTSRIVTATQLRHLTPEQGAALWLVRRDGEGVVGDASLFHEWLENAENREAWDRAQALWALFDDLEPDDLGALRAEALEAATASPWWARHLYVAGALAAALLVLLAGTLYLLSASGPAGREAIVASREPSAVYVTDANRGSSVVLSDGSRIALRANSRLRTTITASTRAVALERGRAFFDVAHDRTRPFVVTAGKRAVTALGTRFNVSLSADGVRVALVEGRVRVAASGAVGVILLPGQQLVTREGQPDAVSAFDVAVADDGDQFVEFDNEMLGVAAAAMARDGELWIIVDPAVATMRVSGRFRRGDPLRFAQKVTQILPVRIVRGSSRELTLRKK